MFVFFFVFFCATIIISFIPLKVCSIREQCFGNVYFIRLCNFLVFIDFSVHDDFKSVIKDCYAPYAPGIEDQDPFGVGNGSA